MRAWINVINEALNPTVANVPVGGPNTGEHKYFGMAYCDKQQPCPSWLTKCQCPGDRFSIYASNDEQALLLAKVHANKNNFRRVYVETDNGTEIFDGEY